jgi:hypothetical protein
MIHSYVHEVYSEAYKGVLHVSSLFLCGWSGWVSGSSQHNFQLIYALFFRTLTICPNDTKETSTLPH